MKKVGSTINERKTKFMQSARLRDKRNPLEIENYSFERATSFAYIGSLVNEKNIVSDKIKIRIGKRNRTYFVNKNLLG